MGVVVSDGDGDGDGDGDSDSDSDGDGDGLDCPCTCMALFRTDKALSNADSRGELEGVAPRFM